MKYYVHKTTYIQRILEYMDEMCTQYQCHFKEEPFVCYRAIDLHPKLYICYYYASVRCTL